ncbi:MAG: hypothetical protein ABSC23_20365 [Bryobacteraceae bacterium]
MQIEKKRIVAITSAAVSDPLDAFGNLIRKKRSNPNSATRNKLNHASSAGPIQSNDDRLELKKSQKSHEEFVKASGYAPVSLAVWRNSRSARVCGPVLS